MSELLYKSMVLPILEEHFEIYTEVMGQHFSGKTLRLDAIAIPRFKMEWKTPNVVLGIEFKDDKRLINTRDYTSWLAQCVDYSHTFWDQYGYIYIFACPGLIEGLHNTVTVGDVSWLLPRIMGHLGLVLQPQINFTALVSPSLFS